LSFHPLPEFFCGVPPNLAISFSSVKVNPVRIVMSIWASPDQLLDASIVRCFRDYKTAAAAGKVAFDHFEVLCLAFTAA
jgi:hypothetical protein